MDILCHYDFLHRWLLKESPRWRMIVWGMKGFLASESIERLKKTFDQSLRNEVTQPIIHADEPGNVI